MTPMELIKMGTNQKAPLHKVAIKSLQLYWQLSFPPSFLLFWLLSGLLLKVEEHSSQILL